MNMRVKGVTATGMAIGQSCVVRGGGLAGGVVSSLPFVADLCRYDAGNDRLG